MLQSRDKRQIDGAPAYGLIYGRYVDWSPDKHAGRPASIWALAVLVGWREKHDQIIDRRPPQSIEPARPAYITQTMWLTPRVMMNVHGFAM